MALGATSEDERVALDCRMVAFENRMEEEKWPNLSPRDKMKMQASVCLRKEKPCWKSKSKAVRESMLGKSFSGLRFKWAGGSGAGGGGSAIRDLPSHRSVCRQS